MNCYPFYHHVGNRSTNITTVITDKDTQYLIGNGQVSAITTNTLIYQFSTLANLALIYGLRKTNKKLAISQKLYVYLSVTDALFSLFIFSMSLLPFIPSLSVNCTTRSIEMAISVYTFGLGLGTFLYISYLRNLAIRKPFKSVTHRSVYLVLAGWNLIMSSTCLLLFFTYEPTYTSTTLYAFSWSFLGISMTLIVVLVIFLNNWSKRILTKQSLGIISENETEKRGRKRNKTAVAILNIVSIIYAVCVLPFAIYLTILGVLTWMQEDFLFSVLRIRFIIYLPLFPCSGLNALAYMLKDKNIRRLYKGCFCCK